MKHGVLGLVLLLVAFVAAPVRAAEKAGTPQEKAANKGWLLHLPGIGGHAGIDDDLIQGLRQGGFGGEIQLYDWVLNPGIPALRAQEHNRKEAKKVAALILDRRKAHPNEPIVLTGHSAGTGVAVWALEGLPDDVKIDTLVMLASALSPDYDLSKALSHVSGKLYAFNNPGDWVLGQGTGVFGTVDGVRGPAAGKVGFACPAKADKDQYAKLVAIPYDPKWVEYDNLGDHIGVMAVPFAKAVLSPIAQGKLPPASVAVGAPATRPAESSSDRPAPDKAARPTAKTADKAGGPSGS